LNADNSSITERICIKFDTDTEKEALEQVLPSKFISDKIKDGSSQGRIQDLGLEGVVNLGSQVGLSFPPSYDAGIPSVIPE